MDQRSGLDRERLQRAMALSVPGGVESHVVVLMPSFSIGDATFEHYAPLFPVLEHRYLTSLPLLARVPGCEIVYLCSVDPGDEVIEYHLSLVADEIRDDVRRRFHLVALDDEAARPLAAKILDRPDVLALVGRLIGGRPAYVEPWNVTDLEQAVGERLSIPIHGTDPSLWPLGFKSSGRRLFREAGVPVPEGVEDIRSTDDLVAAVLRIRSARPGVEGVVVKHDNAGAGEGNAVLRTSTASTPQEIWELVTRLPDHYLGDLASGGGIVEELIAGAEFASPSAQVDIGPDRSVVVRATHEQLLGGPLGQSFSGCRLPARQEYASELAAHARAVGTTLALRGVVGRLSVDFAAARDRDGSWRIHALEINLRKGGTTHPYVALRHLAPGRYDSHEGVWRCDADGSVRAYFATDDLEDPRWVGLTPSAVVDHLAGADLVFDGDEGAVLHMLSGLERHGRFGVITIGREPAAADAVYEAVVERMQTMGS